MASIRHLVRQPGERRWVVAAWCIPLVVLFGPACLPDQTLAFRDAAHYYAPLFRYVQSQWSHGLPLWNPLEENGRPLLADPTASVLYPGKLVFAAPWGFDVSYELYLVGHILLAGAGAFSAARALGCRIVPSGLAAVAYAFGGSIFFQYCNVIYLVGAAWLPWGMVALVHLLETAPHRGMVELSLVLAMIVLGGDPQMAYLLMLTGGGFLFLRSGLPPESKPAKNEKRLDPSWETSIAASWRSVARRAVRLVAAGGLAGGLTAVQVLPTWQWAQDSDRAIADSVGLPTRNESDEASPVAAQPQVEELATHLDQIYRFSIGPWRWPELVWPGFGGRLFPRNERWMAAIPAEGATWTPSLYMGLWPALLGLAGLRFQRGGDHPWQSCLSWWVVAAVLASLGRYGLGWLAHELQHALGQAPAGWPDPVGGMYWLMTKLLPGFAMFRYPAKLWTLAALGISLLAAIRLERWDPHDRHRWFRRTLKLGILLSIGIAIGWLSRPFVTSRLAATHPDALFGPLQTAAAWNRLLQGGVHAVLVLGFATLLLAPARFRSRRWSMGILIGTSIELAAAQAWMVPTVPQNLFDPASPQVVRRMQSGISPADSDSSPSYLRDPVIGWYPKDWATTSSPSRLAECIRWDRETLRPKYNLDFSCRTIRSTTSFSSAEYRAVLRLLDRTQRQHPAVHASLQDALGMDFLIEPAGEIPPSTADSGPFRLVRNPDPLPRAWVVHQAHRLQPMQEMTWSNLDRRTAQVFVAADGQPRNLRREVVLETGVELPAVRPTASPPDNERNAETCEIVEALPTRITIQAELNQPGYLVLRDAFAPGWLCRSRTEVGPWISRPVLRANRVMRGVALPAGRHELIFHYRPQTLVWGGLLSLLSWLGLGFMAKPMVSVPLKTITGGVMRSRFCRNSQSQRRPT